MEASGSSGKPTRRPVKLACLACRSQRVRCDGLETCERCLKTGKECVYIQSRRGRRLKSSTADASDPSNTEIFAPGNVATTSSVSMQPELDVGLFPDVMIDDEDAVFDSVFFNASYPFTPSLDFLLVSQDFQNPGVLRQYRCDQDILDAYYIWIHPTFPALPDHRYSPVDRPLEWHPSTPGELPGHTPSNPLILAILAIVVMIPMPGRVEAGTPAMRRQFSGAIADRAYESIAFEAQSTRESSTMARNPVHPLLPPEVEGILALCLLGQYEYLQNGNMDKMQRLTREALENAMRLQMHLHTPGTQPSFDDAYQRAWWTVYLCACNVTIVSCVPPIVPLKDPTTLYATAFPKSGDWKLHVKAERLLVLAMLFLMNLIREFGNPAEMELIHKSMQALDGEIGSLLAEVDARESPASTSFQTKVALIRLHSARIKVHRYCALLDDDSPSNVASRDTFLDESAFVVPTSSGNVILPSSNSTADTLATSSSSNRHFPFSSAHSTRCCIESASVILQTLPDLAAVQMADGGSKFYSFTPFACSIMLAGYTFLMLRHKADACGMTTEHGSVERDLPSQCEYEAASCMELLDGFSRVWMHLGDAAMHMKEASRCL